MFELIDLYEQLKADAPENFLIQIDEYPENSSFLIDFAAKETAGKSNVDLLNEYYTRYVRNKLTSSDEGKPVETEIIQGLSIVTFMDWWHNGRPDVLNALKFSLETSVSMPQNYSLDGTYKSGSIGDNVTVDLNSNTNISGEVLGMHSFSSVYDLFVENTEVSKLPNMNVTFTNVGPTTILLEF